MEQVQCIQPGEQRNSKPEQQNAVSAEVARQAWNPSVPWRRGDRTSIQVQSFLFQSYRLSMHLPNNFHTHQWHRWPMLNWSDVWISSSFVPILHRRSMLPASCVCMARSRSTGKKWPSPRTRLAMATSSLSIPMRFLCWRAKRDKSSSLNSGRFLNPSCLCQNTSRWTTIRAKRCSCDHPFLVLVEPRSLHLIPQSCILWRTNTMLERSKKKIISPCIKHILLAHRLVFSRWLVSINHTPLNPGMGAK